MSLNVCCSEPTPSIIGGIHKERAQFSRALDWRGCLGLGVSFCNEARNERPSRRPCNSCGGVSISNQISAILPSFYRDGLASRLCAFMGATQQVDCPLKSRLHGIVSAGEPKLVTWSNFHRLRNNGLVRPAASELHERRFSKRD